MIRLLQSKGTAVFRFAEKSPKGVGQHLKMKKAETLSSKIAEGNVPTPEGLAISHRLLYVQYACSHNGRPFSLLPGRPEQYTV